jgi:tetratricopeptide (TPR) repeat protein
MSYADKLWMFNVRDPNQVRKTSFNLARSAVSMNDKNYLCQFSFGLSYYYSGNYDLSLNHSYNSLQSEKKFAHARRLFASSLFQIDEKKRAYIEINTALSLNADEYGKWRTLFELWRFNFNDDNMKEARKISSEIMKIQPDYPQSYIAFLASLEKKTKMSEGYVKKIYEKIPNFSSGMIKNFHSWIRPDQSLKLISALKKFDL